VIGAADNDRDGIADAYEDYLLKTFAPRIWLHPEEIYKPANAGWFISRSSLRFSHDKFCTDHSVLGLYQVNPQNLVNRWHPFNKSLCRHNDSNLWRSSRSVSNKQNGFFLNLANRYRFGEANRAFWEVYGHVFRTANQRMVIQYWQFYPYNQPGTPQQWNINHEGDWEYTSVTINRDRSPVSVTFSRHGNARTVTPDKVEWFGDHHVTYSAKGSHAQFRKLLNGFGCQHDTGSEFHQTNFDRCGRGIAWDSWNSVFGGIVNVGEKNNPLNNQSWLRFSGYWGEIGAAAFLVDFTSGPLGPAYKGNKWRY